MTFALPGRAGDYAVQIDAPAFVHQELIEILYHTLWETVHVFFEHRELGLDAGPAGFLYPFLGTRTASSTRGARGRRRAIDRREGDATSNGCATRSDAPKASTSPTRSPPSTSGCSEAAS